MVERLARVQPKWYDRTGFLSNPHIKRTQRRPVSAGKVKLYITSQKAGKAVCEKRKKGGRCKSGADYN